MSVFVSHNSACWFWRNADDLPIILANRREGCWGRDFPVSPITPDLLIGSAVFGDKPIHLLTPSAGQRPQRAKYCYHVCTKTLSPELFCKLKEGVFVASPELTLAQLAQHLPPFQFVDLCMEFMGMYALRDDVNRGLSERQAPLVSKEKLLSTLRVYLGRDSYRQIRQILDHVAEGSRSPMETREYLLLFLPKKYGGYGLPKAEMNARIDLLPSQQIETGRQYIECDLFWPEHRVAVEYDGDYDHASYGARMRDATKRNALQVYGVRQFTVTARQVFDAHAFDAVARDIAKTIDYKMKNFPADWIKRRDMLRCELLGSLQRS